MIRTLISASLLAIALLVVQAAPAGAAFSIAGAGASLATPDGTRNAQAGAHPDFTTKIEFPSFDQDGYLTADGNVKDIDVDLPRGLVGNPTVAATCTQEDLRSGGFFSSPLCPTDSQVGIAEVRFSYGSELVFHPAVYNVEVPRGEPALFGYSAVGVIILLRPELRGNDYGLTVRVRDISQSIAILDTSVTLWGVPASPVHDAERADPSGSRGHASGLPQKAFMTAPTHCDGPQTISMRARSWQDQGNWSTASFDTDLMGDPLQSENCEVLPFDPSLVASLSSTAPDSPTGLTAALDFPQDGLTAPDGLGTAHLKDVTATLPEGLTVNPASADGLVACSDGQLGLGSTVPSTCPEASKIGTVTATTPLLAETIEGGVYLRPQASSDPESGEMYRLALVLRNDERGIVLKLPGSVRADSDTGRLTATFENNPQLPVSHIEIALRSGSRAALATPDTCGARMIQTRLRSWGEQLVDRQAGIDVNTDCAGGGFAPAFAAGSSIPTAGELSPFAVRIARQDRQQHLSGVSIDMPRGLLARLKGVPVCPESQAAAGTCDAGSRVGSATVGAGAGGTPFYLRDQPVYLAGPYKGAPYSLSVAAHAVAGPFDLGTVVVRQALRIDPEDAHVTVDSDPLPRILGGVPLRLRTIDVKIDRAGFTFNPTSCAEKRIAATLTSTAGAVHKADSRFQVGECTALDFKPKLAMRLTGKSQTRTGGHPALKSVLTQAKGQANIGRAKVTLPKSVALDAVNSADPKLVCDYDKSLKADCPAGSVIGKATAVTPVLDKPLTGNVHLVQGIKFGKNGNRVRTFPTLLVKLRGEVAINVRAKTNVSKNNRLETIFPAVPDAPVSKFTLNINGGKKGILVVTRTAKANINLCNGRQIAQVETDGHNGKTADFATSVKTPCAKKAAKRAKQGGRRR